MLMVIPSQWSLAFFLYPPRSEIHLLSLPQLALTAATPIYRGYLTDVDCRWDIISGSVDCRW